VLYHGFAVHGNTVHFREGFRSAAGVLAHLGDVKAPLDAAVAMVGEGGLDFAVMGPDSELDKLKGPLGTLGTKFYELDRDALWMGVAANPDTHVTLVPYFTVPKGRMDASVAGFGKFYEGTRAGSHECLDYGFAVDGNKVFCHEGYTSAAGVRAHLGDVKASLDAVVAMAGEGGLDLSVMGPAAELAELKDATRASARTRHACGHCAVLHSAEGQDG